MDRPHIDHSRHKYVWRDRGHGPELDGYEAPPPYGWMWDGATCVKDLRDKNSAWHDAGYRTGGMFIKDGKEVKLSRTKMDWIYAKYSGKVSKWRRPVRFIGLHAFGGVSYYKAYRRRKRLGIDGVIAEDVIPSPDKWEFPTSRTRDAIWKG